ncbi:hypothetical protein [Paenibacillus sp. IHBB 10380]|uniref:hypothetical protein n=1 Tax=Paenibacillus sp. IHBB 10380 TaxID=1566358 RepID=UPI0005CFDA83|nr:hypothetical protein [Paenibacillus sp. IHBB 10380]AJS60079.1 hypothetical protein UB51_18150 [Paenibacillus sp. IHBB 10380]
MSKVLSIWFSVSSILLLAASAIAISHYAWLALLLAVLAIFNIGWGFIIKAKHRKSSIKS